MLEVNKIYNLDCLEGVKKIPNESVDLIVTDPPYLMSYKTNYRKDKEHKFCSEILNDDNPELITQYINECYRIMKHDTAMYMFCNSNKIDFFKKELEKQFIIKNIIVWVKNNWTAGDLEAQFGKQHEFIFLVNKGRACFNGDRITDVWCFDRVTGDSQLHQNQKPFELIKQCILKHSKEGDLVFDGFMGSGTTAAAAKFTGRNFLGFEIDEEYYNIAQSRLSDIYEQISLF